MRPRLTTAITLALVAIAACSSTSSSSGSGDSDRPLDPGKCRTDGDCDLDQVEYCARPGEGPGCGACFSGDCTNDQECAASYGEGYICGELTGPCTCPGPDGRGECTPGCTLSGCGPAADCGADGRCVTRTCSTDSDCGDPKLRCAGGLCTVPQCLGDADCDPPNTRCNTDTYRCYRQSCQSDADCGGYCVKGECYAEPGSCEIPAA